MGIEMDEFEQEQVIRKKFAGAADVGAETAVPDFDEDKEPRENPITEHYKQVDQADDGIDYVM